MTQLLQVSDEVRNIINKFINKFANVRFKEDKNNTLGAVDNLLVSLYALRRDAQTEILDTLRDEIVDLSAYLTLQELNTLRANYAEVVRYALFEYDPSASRHGGLLKTPKELALLCHSLAHCKENARILLPFAGEASLAAALPKTSRVKGFETNPKIRALAHINLLLSGLKAEVALGGGCDTGEVYDYIFCHVPFVSGKDVREIARKLLDIAQHNLAHGGEMYCVMPESYCYGSEWFELRKLPYDSKEYSTMVVSLPSGLLAPNSGMRLCLLNITRDKGTIVTLVNAKDEAFLTRIERQRGGYRAPFSSALNVEAVLAAIRTPDPKYVWTGDIQEVEKRSRDMDMTPGRFLPVDYDIRLAAGERLARLKDLVTFVSPERPHDTPTKLPMIGMRELSDNYLNCDIQYSQIPLADRFCNRVITSDCLLMGFIGGGMKVARLKGVSADRPVAIRQDIVPFVVTDKDLITEDYLLKCLLGEFVGKQANAKATGMTITRLKEGDYKALEIVLPGSIEEQKRICTEDTRKGLTDADRKLLENNEEFRKDMHMKKHAMGQTILNFNNWLQLLLKARENGNGTLHDNDEVGKTRKVKVADIYDNLQCAMSRLSLQLSKFDTGYGLSVQDIALTDFIERYISTHKSPQFEFVYDAAPHRASENLTAINSDDSMSSGDTQDYILRVGDPLESVKFPPEALTTVFDNIVSNACSHGFKGREDKANDIRIEISSEGTDYVVTVSNNGAPLPHGFTTEDIFLYGQTSGNTKEHCGIGGYEVRKLMREFDGDAQIISTPDNEYTVSYRLVFHNTNIASVL